LPFGGTGAKALSLGEKKVSDAAEGRFLSVIGPLSSSIPSSFVFKGLGNGGTIKTSGDQPPVAPVKVRKNECSIGCRLQRNLGWRVKRIPICVCPCHLPVIFLTHLFSFLQTRRTCLDDIIDDSADIFNFKQIEGEAEGLKALSKGEVKDDTSTLPYGIDKSKDSRGNTLAAAECSFFGRWPRLPPLLLSTAKGLHEKSITMVDKGRFYAGTYSFRGAIEVC
jgi:hypothetical protein